MCRMSSGRKDAWAFGEIAPDHLARLTGVSVVTARRWIRLRALPEPARILAELRLHGDLGAIDAAFSGVLLRRGALHLDTGMIVERGELNSIPYRRQQVRALEARLARAAPVEPDESSHDQVSDGAFRNSARG